MGNEKLNQTAYIEAPRHFWPPPFLTLATFLWGGFLFTEKTTTSKKHDHEHTGITYSLKIPENRHWASCDGVAWGIGNVAEGGGWALATRPRAFFVGDGT